MISWRWSVVSRLCDPKDMASIVHNKGVWARKNVYKIPSGRKDMSKLRKGIQVICTARQLMKSHGQPLYPSSLALAKAISASVVWPPHVVVATGWERIVVRNVRGRNPRTLRHHTDIPTRKFRSSLCGLWRHIYSPLNPLGLADR